MNYSGALSPPSSTSSIVPLAPAGMIPIAYDSQWSILNGVGQDCELPSGDRQDQRRQQRQDHADGGVMHGGRLLHRLDPPRRVPNHARPVTSMVSNARRLAIRHCRLQLSPPHKVRCGSAASSLGQPIWPNTAYYQVLLGSLNYAVLSYV